MDDKDLRILDQILAEERRAAMPGRPLLFPRTDLLAIVSRERYPRFRTFRAQVPQDVHGMEIRRTLAALVEEGRLVQGGLRRDPYWCRPEDARG